MEKTDYERLKKDLRSVSKLTGIINENLEQLMEADAALFCAPISEKEELIKLSEGYLSKA